MKTVREHMKFTQIDANEWEWSLPEFKKAPEKTWGFLYGRVEALDRAKAKSMVMDELAKRLRIALTYMDDAQKTKASRDNKLDIDHEDVFGEPKSVAEEDGV